jgi:hypothetical protein
MYDNRGRALTDGVWQFYPITQPGPPAAPLYDPADWLELNRAAPVNLFNPGYYQGGTATLRSFIYVNIDPGTPGALPPIPPGISYERFIIRKRGRAYFTPRGRRPKVVC